MLSLFQAFGIKVREQHEILWISMLFACNGKLT